MCWHYLSAWACLRKEWPSISATFHRRAGRLDCRLCRVERHGKAALLCSLAVAPEAEGGGLGRRLTGTLLAVAKADGVREVVLLTTTAAEFFTRKFNFAPAARAQYDETFATSPEWHLPRCASAACLSLHL